MLSNHRACDVHRAVQMPGPHGAHLSPGKEGDALGRGSTLNQPGHSVPETLGQSLPSGDQVADKALWLGFS